MKKLLLLVILLTLIGCKSTSTSSDYPDEVRQFHMESIRPHLEKNGNIKYIELFGTNGCKELLQVIDRLNISPTLVERKKIIVNSDINGEEFKFTYDTYSCPKNRVTSSD